jgi:hypothetical protein
MSTATPLAFPSVQVVDDVRHVEGIPGVFRRSGRYLYLLTSRSHSVVADGTLVDGLVLIRTDPSRPTRIVSGGNVFEGVEDDDHLGVRWLGRTRV